MMNRKYLIGLSLILAFFLIAHTPKTETTYPSPIVLELFTSQGCSSCPSADVLVDKVAVEFTKDNIITLSYHVDYWDYIGWKDPFSKKEHTQKQRAYARKFYDTKIYTPAVVINGKEHFVGSNSTKMYDKIKKHKTKRSTNQLEISSVQKNNKIVSFAYKIDGGFSTKKLRAVLAIKERTTNVKRGENRNRTLKNNNIVVNEMYMEIKASGTSSIAIPEIVNASDALMLVLVLEDEKLDIVAAAKKNLS